MVSNIGRGGGGGGRGRKGGGLVGNQPKSNPLPLQIITVLILKLDNIPKSRIELNRIFYFLLKPSNEIKGRYIFILPVNLVKL